MNPTTMIELLDYKRRVAELYAEIRAQSDPETAWERWRKERDRLFTQHPQSALSSAERGPGRLSYFAYDPSFRVHAELKSAPPVTYDVASSDGGTMSFTRIAQARFSLQGLPKMLECFWLEGYGGGLFLPFKDTTSGHETYGGGRYLFDTIKGADLGTSEGPGGIELLLLDFNFAYNPSCSYDPRWACPLSPPTNRLEIEVRAGERHRA